MPKTYYAVVNKKTGIIKDSSAKPQIFTKKKYARSVLFEPYIIIPIPATALNALIKSCIPVPKVNQESAGT